MKRNIEKMFSTVDHIRSNPNPSKYPLLDPHHFVPDSGSESVSFYGHGFTQDSSNRPSILNHAPTAATQNSCQGVTTSSTVDALLSEFNHFTSTMNQNFDCGQVNFGSFLKTESPVLVASPPLPALDNRPTPCTSSEALLNVILVTQQKLQNLQSVVQMMVHGGGQHHHSPQSLAASFTSIMSQLFAATSGLQTPPGHITYTAQLDQKFDSRFDGLNDHGGNNSLFSPVGNYVLNNDAFFNGNAGDCNLLISDMETNSNSRAAPKSRAMDNGPMPGKGSVMTHNGAVQNCVGSTTASTVDAPQVEHIKSSPNSGFDPGSYPSDDASAEPAGMQFEDQDYVSNPKEEEDDGDGENLPPGSYELIEMAAGEILAEHTHFCDICGKGFKRDANLRMHMRGHGDEYKTPAALARPDKTTSDPLAMKPRRYSCPYVGCKRNRKHRKFLPLKTVLCVKNHYRRSHCPKLLTCSKCKAKKFSVVADLKTHEKHCGRDKWQCSCGTTFSRKDKLVGHLSLFVGHTPAVPLNDGESHVVSNIESNHVGCFSSSANGSVTTEAMYQSRSGAANGGQVIKQAGMINRESRGMNMCAMSIASEGTQGRENNFQPSTTTLQGSNHVFLGI